MIERLIGNHSWIPSSIVPFLLVKTSTTEDIEAKCFSFVVALCRFAPGIIDYSCGCRYSVQLGGQSNGLRMLTCTDFLRSLARAMVFRSSHQPTRAGKQASRQAVRFSHRQQGNSIESAESDKIKVDTIQWNCTDQWGATETNVDPIGVNARRGLW